jgi:hypothetical protein
MALTKPQAEMLGTGAVVQIKNYLTSAVATGTTLVPFDDTIPQNTEGDQYMSLAITPKATTNLLKIDIVCHITNTATTGRLTAALFQDSGANALAAATTGLDTASFQRCITFTHFMTAGTTSSTTFYVRAGCNGAGTTTFNGSVGNRLFGGVIASSITITEIAG